MAESPAPKPPDSDPHQRAARTTRQAGLSDVPPDQSTIQEILQNTDIAGSGLHIRCPHCRNQVEFLEEHEHSDITCGTCGSVFSLINPAVDTRDHAAMRTVGHFELLDRVGIGSFGAVWKAYDPELDRTVAVKIPRRGQLDPMGETQFLREARVAAQLKHPHIVSVHEVGREGDTLYIVSDFIRGVTLAELFKVRRFDIDEMLELMLRVTDALHHAHERGVIHRDLKPSNILIDENQQPHLTDFGLAKRDVGELTMTADGQILGTPAYMSPEQAAGEAHHVDRRTDVYAIGVMLFELLTGELPFRGSAQMHIHQKLHDDPPNPRNLSEYVPKDMATICVKCVQRDPNQRYPTAAAVRDDLARFQRREPIRARPISRLERAFRWARRAPYQAATLALLAVLAIAGPAVAWWTSHLLAREQESSAQREKLLEARIAETSAAVAAADEQREELESLRQRLGAWEGGVDPAAFWPPDKISNPRAAILRQLVGDADYVQEVLDSASNAAERAMARHAFGVAFARLEMCDEAIEHLSAARKTLETMLQTNADQNSLVLALATCLEELAALKLPLDRSEALADFSQAQDLLQQAQAADDDPRLTAALFDLDLRATTAAGRDAAAESFLRTGAGFGKLADDKPKDPQALYELATFLAGKPAFLAESDE